MDLSIIEIVALCVASIAALFVFYALLFTAYHSKYKLLAYPAAPLFLLCDFLVNMVPVSILFLDPPREALCTARLKRWKKIPDGAGGMKKVRWRFAWWICEKMNKYDPGHC